MARMKIPLLLILLWTVRGWAADQSADEMRNAAGDCARCHVISVIEWGYSRHYPKGADCVDCHGESLGHVRDERNNVKPDQMPRAKAIAELCASCHEKGCPETKESHSCQKCHHVHALVDPRKPAVVRDERLEQLDLRWQRYDQNMREGEQFAKAEKWSEARAAFERALADKPKDRAAIARMDMCQRRLNPQLPGFEIVGNTYDEATGLPCEVKISGLGIPMRLVAGGELTMGSDLYRDTKPVHQVTIKPFYLARHELTQDEWTALLSTNPSAHQGTNFTQTGRWPVERVSWEDAQRLVQALNQRVAGGGFRLPEEPEWEFAARAGGETGEAFGLATPAPVEQGKPNRFGLFDMAGNVREWCSSIYAPYPLVAASCPEPKKDAILRVLRGGAFVEPTEWYDPAMRHSERPGRRSIWNGLRLARSIPEQH
jgi:formylglycine-generating enzyme required for sulfatase activity